MTFAPKSAAPKVVRAPSPPVALERIADNGLTLISSSGAHLPAEMIATTLLARHQTPVWLRVGVEDSDPAMLLISLVHAARRLAPGFGGATLEAMRRSPGPICGWPQLFVQLGHELAGALPPGGALVIEHVHLLAGQQPTLGLLLGHLLPPLLQHTACVVTSTPRTPPGAAPSGARAVDAAQLRVDLATALRMADAADAGLSRRALERATAVSGGAVGIVGDICAAAATLGAPLVEQSLVQAGSADDLLARLARAWISTATAETQQALALALHLEYSHPQLMAAALDAGRPPVGPWMVPLAEGWQWVRRHWREPMRRAMRAGARPAGTQLHRAACWLGEQGATERAIPLLLEAGDLNTAAQMIAAAADGCMSHGQWQTLAGWLDALPSATLRAWPWLIYAGGDLASARGQPGVARKAFDMAASLFTARHDPEGACQSMLAESALAAWQGDRAHAQARALAASTIADAVNLSWYQAWAAWQLGCLAASTGELDDALAYFERAAAAAAVVGDPMVLDLLRQVDALVLRQRDIRRQRDFHQQAFVAAERAELEAAEHLRRALSAPPEGLDLLLDVHGWSRMPLMLKLPAPVLVANEDAEPERKSLWQSLLGVVGLRRRPRLEPELAPPPAVLSLRPSLSLVRSQLELEAVTVAVDVADARSGAGSGLLEREVNALPPTELVLLPASPESGDPALTPPALAVHMLGPFRVLVNERAVESWPSGRGRALFKYLAAHHPQPIARDTLMDMFWPEAAPEAARNSLNVALHGLRQAFRALTDVPVVLFHEGAYRINPELRLWVDAEEFERRVDAGRRIQGVGELGGATAEYEVATGLYQGDFMADDPYDDWPVLARERLRVSYLDTLDRLGQIYFGQGKYAACANLCQLILVRDSCREDAHCRLMRCYARQGQHPLALRQYQACVEALRKELDVEPAPATTQLGERIRRREQV